MSDACSECGASSGRRAFIRRLVAMSGLYVLPLARQGKDATVEYPVPLRDGAFIDRQNDVILMRWEQQIYAFSLACPHQNTALRWRAEDRRFQCPKHHSRYRPDGSFISGRATRGMDRFDLSHANGIIAVHLDRLFSQTDDPAGWAAAVVRL